MKIFYNPRQAVSDNKSFSKSAEKPKLFVDKLQRENFNFRLFVTPEIRVEHIYLAHDKEYVDGVLNLEINNGFGNKMESVRNSFRYSLASFVGAAAVAHKEKMSVCSPTSGFHHAGYDYGSGFCTFNGLLIAAEVLRKTNPQIKIGIIDLDMHHGDGTLDIINKLNLTNIKHYSFAEQGVHPSWAEQWLDRLAYDLYNRFNNMDIIFYQAGADPHIDDPLGGALTTEQLRIRDSIVFNFCKFYGIPCVWNLAGGYQENFEDVLNIHYNTAKEFETVYMAP